MTHMTTKAIQANEQLAHITGLAPLIPVLVVREVAHAKPLGEILISAGLPALEVTLRSPEALDVIAAMSELPGGVVGAGTVLSAQHAKAAKEAGARFAVSPGATPALIDACEAEELPLLAGVSTASEAMVLRERGYSFAKFFPAEASGGAAMLKALGGPLPDMKFCPTGGLTPDNVTDYLALPNIVCAGGSWLAPDHLLARQAWDEIEALAQSAATLTQTFRSNSRA